MNGYVSKRNNASQPFGYDELVAILDIEAKRPIVEAKRDIALVDYSLPKKWLEEIGIDIEPFTIGNDVENAIKKGNQSKEKVGPLTLEMIHSRSTDFIDLIRQITSYLGQEDKLEKSDFIFVFGGKNTGRIHKAIELWKSGMAPKIWISGSHPIYREYEPEALTFKRVAIEAGIPEDCIFVEPDSITIADNCRRSLNLMDERNIKFEKIILVTSWYAQKRAWMMMEKYVSVGAKLFNSNAIMESDNHVSPSKWYESEYGINIVFNEFLKMRVHDTLVANRLI
ncbi:MAG: YdcF family protein [Candidatus Roizmanbacteria bacterium]